MMGCLSNTNTFHQIRPVQSKAFLVSLFIFSSNYLDRSELIRVELVSMNPDRTMYIARVHWPPMNKFVCKIHGYIVYFT